MKIIGALYKDRRILPAMAYGSVPPAWFTSSGEGECDGFPHGLGCARCRLNVLKQRRRPTWRIQKQKGNREKRKPKKEKPKGAPVVSSFGAPSKAWRQGGSEDQGRVHVSPRPHRSVLQRSKFL